MAFQQFFVPQGGGTTAVGRAGPAGPQGAMGPQGPEGSPATSYIHQQDDALAVWEVAHNLDSYPSVTITGMDHVEYEADVLYHDADSLRITFSAPFNGYAYLN